MAAATQLAAMLDRLPEFLVDARIAGYWASRGEMPLHAAFAALRARSQEYLLPILGGKLLHFAPWQTGAALRNNRFGIPEPECAPQARVDGADLDLVLMPLLAFDRNGNRLGSGGGWYDRTFAFLQGLPRPAHPLLVGIGYHFQEVDALAARAWDIPMDYVATDRELIECPQR